MQLVAYGAQDIYLTGNPQITFFKVVYRRHTNFSMEAIEQTLDGTVNKTGRCTATISRNGDLVHRMFFEITLGPDPGGSNGSLSNPGAAFIINVELEIGGQKIDKHSGLWMETWAELTEINPTGMIGSTENENDGTAFQNMSKMGGVDGSRLHQPGAHYFIPLQFWFCRNPGLSLPLIALQYHEVKVILNHQISEAFGNNGTVNNQLWCDYIYLDTDERRRFAQVSHEYLIEQVQEQSMTTGVAPTSTDLHFNHPVKELIWSNSNKITNAASASGNGIMGSMANQGTYKLNLNGHDRFAARDWRYFARVQVWQYHSGAGGLWTDPAGFEDDWELHGRFNCSIGVYSFALKPEEHQPSGTCNFSRIDNAQLVVEIGHNIADTIFAVNYNVLRIMSGMGGLAYSN